MTITLIARATEALAWRPDDDTGLPLALALHNARVALGIPDPPRPGVPG
jgi:hypothetical protein